MNVDYISVNGFKSLKSIERLPLKQLNVLVGANGSGKSNFIEVFNFLRAITEGRLQEYVSRLGGANKLLHFGSKQTRFIEITVSFNDEANSYSIQLAPTDDNSLYPRSEQVSFWNKSYPKPYDDSLSANSGGREAGISSSSLKGIPSQVQRRLKGWRVYHVHDTSSSSPMRRPSQVDDNRFLRPDCSNLAAFLYMLKELHPGSYELVRKTVQRVAPFFDDFLLDPSVLKQSEVKLEWKHKGTESYFDATSLSDGTLRFIGLATLLLQPNEFMPSLILIDEPELGFHPYAVQMLASLLRQASLNTQLLIATQSSQLLDNFDPEDILVADRDRESTRVSRLDGVPLESWLEEYSLGQLWEKNEFAGRPS